MNQSNMTVYVTRNGYVIKPGYSESTDSSFVAKTLDEVKKLLQANLKSINEK